MNLPPEKSRLLALCLAASAEAKRGQVHARPAARVYPEVNLAMLRVAGIRDALEAEPLRDALHLAHACLEFVAVSLQIELEKEKAAKDATAAAMREGAPC